MAYAKIGLTGTKFEAFEKVYSEIQWELGAPALLINLKCDTETELGRIRRRDRSEEKMITLEFLDSLNTALEKEVRKYEGHSKVITIDSSIKDFANDESVKNEMRALIDDFISNNVNKI